ncbi:PilZ domain-containing protein [Chelativorans sp. AA-79]|uniref:PilZ domain-containing protein n=1 Tax=Chelativorans sp. AA-79 TaxID=3028735 RepID=UPI0023F88359|nr:PilZ domain-containing protein [Chelativorans sp. AA-79]WEX07066.1 PilZ domain-containing protein [Chelativorans sp. AA-79]
MAVAANPMPMRAERRSFQRVKISLYGRYMLQDRSEHSCRVIDMSPGNVALKAERIGRKGERVVVYLHHIGRIEGRIARVFDEGFAMTINASERKRDKLASQLTWLANRHELDLPEDRRHERITPGNPMSTIRLPDGHEHPCRIVDLSASGAAIETAPKPAIGTPVFLGNLRGEVVRHFEHGFALEFAVLQEPAALLAEFE